MLTVTERAAQFIMESLSRRKDGSPEALRIVRTDDGFELALDTPRDGDQLFEQGGHSYLVMDPQVGDALADATLDVLESSQGSALTLTGTGF